MKERTQFYLNQDAEFGRPERRYERAPRHGVLYEFFAFLRSLFMGITLGVMLSLYTFGLIIVLDRLGAPMPYIVQKGLAEVEYRAMSALYELKYGNLTERIYSYITPTKTASE
ncbi:MAG: hypothetical protein KDD70_18380 [Bdellovibrionales bacterium]|nr:hypothetical protein [Bdellovibrionales bacterium]